MSKVLETAVKEVLRREILELCSSAAPVGCSVDVLVAAFAHKDEGNKEELERQIDYLEAKGLVSVKEVGNKQLGMSKKVVTITAQGTDFLEGNTGSITGIGE